MDRENQRVAITKRLLKESMLRLMKEKEVDKITVTEICREAEINRATFYRHYEIPRDVLMEIQRDLYQELRQQVKMPKFSDDVRPAIEKMCDYLDEHSALLRILIRSNTDVDFAAFINDMFMDLAKEHSHLSGIKNLSVEDIQLLSLYSAGGSYFVLRSWITGSIKKSPAEMASYVYGLAIKTEPMLISSLSEREKK